MTDPEQLHSSSFAEQEQNFRQQMIQRLIAEHQDMDEERVQHWLALLNDPDPRGRVMAATAIKTMMDVRDYHKNHTQ